MYLLSVRACSLFRLPLLILLLLTAATASAGAGDEAAQDVRKSTDDLVAMLNEERDTFYRNPDRFYEIMESALVDVVDFKRIAARVMGKHRRSASADQQARFVSVFKQSLFRAYGKTLVESGKFKVTILGGESHPRDPKRANVNLEVRTSSGNTYPVVYSMYLSDDRGWLLENVIVNGVNVGLAFRNKFEQMTGEYRGDIDKVLRNWTESVEKDDELDAKGES